MSLALYLLAMVLATYLPTSSNAHGRLLEPISRASAYLAGYGTPVNYDDHEMYCGGRAVQWQQNGGKCGICGDPYQGPLTYERPNGSRVQHNVITATYVENQSIVIKLQIAVAHKGWHEFRICDVAKSGGIEATQECLNRTLLADEQGNTRFYEGTAERGYYNYPLVLPEGLTCKLCVIQWKWKCGNDWGCQDGRCCTGCNDVQEEFYGCSDVTINQRDARFTSEETTASSTIQTATTTPEITTTSPTTTRSPDTMRATTQQSITSTFIPTRNPPTTLADTTTTTSTTTTTTAAKTTATTTTATTAPAKTTKQPQFSNNFFEYFKKNPQAVSNSSGSGKSSIYFSNSRINNPTSSNKVVDDAALNMILGSKYTISGNSVIANIVPVSGNGASSILNDPTQDFLDKDTKDRLCASCFHSCHFSVCFAQCPYVCTDH